MHAATANPLWALASCRGLSTAEDGNNRAGDKEKNRQNERKKKWEGEGNCRKWEREMVKDIRYEEKKKKKQKEWLWGGWHALRSLSESQGAVKVQSIELQSGGFYFGHSIFFIRWGEIWTYRPHNTETGLEGLSFKSLSWIKCSPFQQKKVSILRALSVR